METCFRFLINVDQCLNMSNFDIFFYKLESQHKFHLNQVQLFGDSFSTSLRHAVSDIRMYLDKYPYHVGDYQLIVAMRGMYKKRSDNWEETMLYRLLQLNFELRRSRIFINSQESAEKALNLIMLYDADFSTELPKLGDYMTSCRFQTDCALFLRHIGIADPHIDYATLKKKLMDEIIPMVEELDQSGDKKLEKKIDKHKKLIEECNEKMEAYEDELLELPREIDQTNYQLMLLTMDVCYDVLQEGSKELEEIENATKYMEQIIGE